MNEMERIEKELKEIIDKMGRMPMAKELKKINSGLYNRMVKTGGAVKWAKRLGLPYGKKYVCRYCGKVFYDSFPRKACDDRDCQRALHGAYYHKPTKNDKRPFSYDTDMLLIIDLEKGWSPEKVARINAEILNRDYEHLIEHVYALQNSKRGQLIKQRLNTYRKG